MMIKNKLNNLTGKEWVKFTKSWMIHNPPRRGNKKVLHPACFPETLVQEFIEFFTKKDQIVLDVFVGTGSTLVACDRSKRKGIGIELIKKYYNIAKKRTKQKIILGDARDLDKMNLPEIHFCISSPPYWNMLRKSRGNNHTTSKKRIKNGLDVYYSDDKRDLGNIDDYEEYLNNLYDIFKKVHGVLKDGAYLVIIIQNVRTPSGEMKPLAWDLAKKLSKFFVLKQEKIWCQDNKFLGCWGYPSEYVSNVHHHYCLIFKKVSM